MSSAQIGYGTRFYMMATTAATALTKLAEVSSTNYPNEQTAEIEVTHYESPGRTREYIAGLSDAGELTLTLNWVPGSATDDMLVAAKADAKVRTMRIVTPVVGADPGQMFTFPGFVKGIDRAAPVDDKMTVTITVRIAGAVTIDDATADPTVIA